VHLTILQWVLFYIWLAVFSGLGGLGVTLGLAQIVMGD
jgi:hypothetical protein